MLNSATAASGVTSDGWTSTNIIVANTARVMQFQDFDADYIRRLVSGDPAGENHFASYFGELIEIKLRGRVQPATNWTT